MEFSDRISWVNVTILCQGPVRFTALIKVFSFSCFNKVSCYIILYLWVQLAYPAFYATRILHDLWNLQMTHQDDFWYSVDNSRGFAFFINEP